MNEPKLMQTEKKKRLGIQGSHDGMVTMTKISNGIKNIWNNLSEKVGGKSTDIGNIGNEWRL